MEHKHALTTFRHRDFTLLWLGQVVSGVGDTMQVTAIAWHMFILTGSALQLGLIGLVRAVPFMLLSLFGGAAADVTERKRLILVAQIVQIAITSILVAASFGGWVTVWVLYAVTFLGGAASAFDQPARQALVPNLVPRSELANAFSLTTLLRQITQIAGPGIGGIAIGTVGLGATYLANAASFLAVVIALLLMGPVPMLAAERSRNWERVVGGLRFAQTEPMVIVPLLLDFLTRCFVTAQPLLPIFAAEIFHMGPQGFGWLSVASSAGAIAGGLVMGAGRYGRHPLLLMVAGYAIEGVFLIGFGVSSVFGVAMAMLFMMGVGNVVGEVVRSTVVQLKTPDELRGRVAALANMFGAGGPQLGRLEMGALAAAMGPMAAAVVGGAAVLAITAGFCLPRSFRRELLNFSFEQPREAEVVS